MRQFKLCACVCVSACMCVCVHASHQEEYLSALTMQESSNMGAAWTSSTDLTASAIRLPKGEEGLCFSLISELVKVAVAASGVKRAAQSLMSEFGKNTHVLT